MICGGVSPNEHPATPEVQAMCDALRDPMLDQLRRRGWNGSFKVFEVVSFKTQVRRMSWSITATVVCCDRRVNVSEICWLGGGRGQLLCQSCHHRHPVHSCSCVSATWGRFVLSSFLVCVGSAGSGICALYAAPAQLSAVRVVKGDAELTYFEPGR